MVKCGVKGRSINASAKEQRQNREPRGRGGQRPQREEREDGCVTLLGRSHQGRSEAVDTLRMISHGVEISIAGGGAEEKDEGNRGLFFYFLFFILFLYHIFVVKVQEIAWSASYGENKTQNPKRTNKRNIRHQNSSAGVRTGPRHTYGHEIKPSKAKETLLTPADSLKKSKICKPSYPEIT